jgi:hypothetical protein
MLLRQSCCILIADVFFVSLCLPAPLNAVVPILSGDKQKENKKVART